MSSGREVSFEKGSGKTQVTEALVGVVGRLETSVFDLQGVEDEEGEGGE